MTAYVDQIMNKKTSFGTRLLTPYNGIKVTWFDAWHPVLDEALQTLPEDVHVDRLHEY